MGPFRDGCPASRFPSIEKTDGEPIDHGMGVLKDAGLAWHIELVALLESPHGPGHGHASARVAHFLAAK